MKEKKKERIEFGMRIKNLRRKRKLTQKELAKAVGIHYSFQSSIERGEKSPGFEIIIELAKVLDVNVGELFADSESYSKDIVDFLIWLRENPGITFEEVLKIISKSHPTKK